MVPPPAVQSSSDLPTVLLALHDQSVGAALAISLAASCGVVHVGASWDAFQGALEELEPPVALVDSRTGADPLLPRLGRVVRKHAETRFILYTTEPDDILAERAWIAGVAGILTYACPLEQATVVVDALAHGRQWPVHIGVPMRDYPGRLGSLVSLTGPQRDLLNLLWGRKSHAEIAEIMNRSVATVDRAVCGLRRAYGLGRGEVALWEQIRRGRPSW